MNTAIFRTASLLSLLVLAGASADAQTAVQDRCEAGKDLATGKYFACLAKAYRANVIDPDPAAMTTALAKCETKLAGSWAKLELAAAKGGGCPADGDGEAVQDFLDYCATAAAMVNGGEIPVPDVAECAGDLDTCSSTLGTCQTDAATCNAQRGQCQTDLVAAQRCGNGRVDAGEGCDLYVGLDSHQCDDLGFIGGEVRCLPGCVVDTRRCYNSSPKRVFVTSQTFAADLGRAGYDTQCNEAASNAGLGGNWVAWMSDSTGHAFDRIPESPYVRLDGEFVAFSKLDLMDGSIVNPISRSETGVDVTGDVWTGTSAFGTMLSETCLNWSSAGEEQGVVGSSTATNTFWSYTYVLEMCSSTARIYCFEL